MLIDKILTSVRCGKYLLDTSSPVVMGILNITPDSFYAGSRIPPDPEKSVVIASRMASEGASVIDIGGMSTRPGATEVSIQEELDRVIPAIESVAKNLPNTIISVDTYRSQVAKAAIDAGATMINDVSGGSLDEALLDVVASHKVAYVLMHTRGNPNNMQTMTDYQDIISDLLKYFVNKLGLLHHKGIRDIVIDPGFGFAKTMEQNYLIMEHLDIFRFLGQPLMIGLSRKSTLSKTIGRSVEETLEATTALHMAALLKGASILRVHDIKPAMDAIAVYNKLREAKIH